MKLIIHADDFGMAKSINDAIIELCELGTLSSTSVMANMPWSHEVKKLMHIKNISLGLHSTFSQGKPLSPPERIPSLVDSEGSFLNYSVLLKRARQNAIALEEIYEELERQYLYLYELIGDRLVFIDSHHSIHNKVAPFRSAFLRLGKNYNVPVIRTRQLHYLLSDSKTVSIKEPLLGNIHIYGIRKYFVNQYYKRAAKIFSKYFKIADGMIVGDKPGVVKVLKNVVFIKPEQYFNKCFYIVTHPASSVDDISDSNLKRERIEEYEFLKSDVFCEFVKKHPLSHFGAL